MTKSADAASTADQPAAKEKPAANRVKKSAATTLKKQAATTKAAVAKKAKAASKAKPPAKEPAAAREKPAEKEKQRKPKLVRDSFTMPEDEYAVLGEVKKACLKAGIEVKKSELLRVGVALIRQLDSTRLKAALDALPPLKAGRPKKQK